MNPYKCKSLYYSKIKNENNNRANLPIDGQC